MSLIRLFAAAALSLGAVGSAVAQSPTELQAEHAMSALSARYQQIWASLGPTERQAFSAQERAWLNRQRWDEHKQCVAQASGSDAEARSAECQHVVVERRLQHLRTTLKASARS
jgi:uncharacterized protein YecT (DUF1311 family)